MVGMHLCKSRLSKRDVEDSIVYDVKFIVLYGEARNDARIDLVPP